MIYKIVKILNRVRIFLPKVILEKAWSNGYCAEHYVLCESLVYTDTYT